MPHKSPRAMSPRQGPASTAHNSASSPGSLLRWHADSQRRQQGNNSHDVGTRLPKKRPTSPATVTGQGKLLKLATANSLVETAFMHRTPPHAAVFYPTQEQFADPIKYIASIEKEARKTGVCKIVPPAGWKPPFAINLEDERVHFDTRRQRIHELREGHAYGDGRVHSFRSYRDSADAFRRQWFRERGIDSTTTTSDEIEREYWRIVETGGPSIEVEYANDLDITQVGSGFPRSAQRFASMAKKGKEHVDFNDAEYYRNTAWNLNNLPDAYGSLLRHLGAPINGINVPWLYCGMLFASFCWHAEDNYMSSINYQHLGANKRWYGIPSSDAELFESVMRTQVPERFREEPDLLLHLTTMVSPTLLMARGVQVFTLVQEPGDIVLTFPKAYHGGFSEGFNCNEAVNFVLPNWIEFGRECVEMYRMYGRLSIFSHDRFVFHFGSTQNLEEYSVGDCEMLLKELRRLFHEEREYNKAFLADGLESVEELSGDVMLDEQSMNVDDVRQCYLCRHNVFFSGVICVCAPNRLSCLRHARAMCSCGMQNRTLLQWVSTDELRYAIRRVQTKMRALKALSSQIDSNAGCDANSSDQAHSSSADRYYLSGRSVKT